MISHRAIHSLAIFSLLFVAVMSITGSMQRFPGAPTGTSMAPLFGTVIWALLVWKIWKRPRQWGLGVGIFLFLMIVFQSYLWWLGVNDPELVESLGASRSATKFVLFYELPIFIAAVSCTLLRLCFSPNSKDSDRVRTLKT